MHDLLNRKFKPMTVIKVKGKKNCTKSSILSRRSSKEMKGHSAST